MKESSRYSEITTAGTVPLKGSHFIDISLFGVNMSRSNQYYCQLILIFMDIHLVDRKFVSKCIGRSEAQLSNYMTGKNQPNLEMQQKFRDLLGMPLASEVPGKGPFLELRSLLLRAMG